MYELKVEKMSCGGCVRSVTKSVQAVDNNAKVEIDLAAKNVRIDTQASLEEVKSAIVDAGYPVVSSAVT
jgi:copper chaperone